MKDDPDVSIFDSVEYALEEGAFLAQRDCKPYVLLVRECCYVVKPKDKVGEGEIVLETFQPVYN